MPVNCDRNITDSDVIRRAQQGDSNAFASLFHTHKTRIYSLCLRMTNNTAEAEDLTQEAFMQVFRKLPTFRGDSALSTWLYRVAVRTVLMHFRKKTPQEISLDESHEHDGQLLRREYGSRDGRLACSVERIALIRAITKLPEGYRTIFLLHEVDGYEHREIAELLDCSVGNSKSQLHKAKLRIREFLKRTRPVRFQALRRLHSPTERVASQPAPRIESWGMQGADDRPVQSRPAKPALVLLPSCPDIGRSRVKLSRDSPVNVGG
jgi:RNA polymerase sigma-70 factor (ECF subfamily)